MSDNEDYFNDKEHSDEEEELYKSKSTSRNNNVLLVQFTILEVKYFSNLLSFLDKEVSNCYIKFTKNGMIGIKTITNDSSSKGEIDNVDSFMIPKSKLYSYTCNTEFFDDFNDKKPNDCFFRLRFNLSNLCEILQTFNISDILSFTYNNSRKYAIITNLSGKSDTELKVKFSRDDLVNPIQDPIALPDFPVFMNIICRGFGEIVTRMTKTKSKLANKMTIKIQDQDYKGLKFMSSESGVYKTFGNYNSDLKPDKTFRIDSKIMKILTYFIKGNDRGFLEFSYNGNIIKLSIFLGNYIRHEFIIVSKNVK